MFFQNVRIFLNPTNLSFCPFFNQTLILIKLSLIPFGITSMHQREDPVNTIYIPFVGACYSAHFSIPTDSLLLVFLKYSRHLREFCGFSKVPDSSKITCFKQDFLIDLQYVFDSSGIEAFVTENKQSKML